MPQLSAFVAECPVSGLAEDDLRGLHAALESTSARLTAAGEQVIYLRSTFFPDTARWGAVFVAGDPAVVLHVTHIAQLSSVAVHRVVQFGVGGASNELPHRWSPRERNVS